MQRDGGFMDLMDIRREMMGMIAQMSGKVPRLVFSKSITFEETATGTSRKQIQLPVITRGYILILIDKYPTAPDSSIYISMSSYINIFQAYGTVGGGTSILRPNRTIGSDSGGSNYNVNTGILSLGGSYGYYPQGMTYNIYAFEIGDSD